MRRNEREAYLQLGRQIEEFRISLLTNGSPFPKNINDVRRWVRLSLGAAGLSEDGRIAYKESLKNYENSVLAHVLSKAPPDETPSVEEFAFNLVKKASVDPVAFNAAIEFGADFIERQEKIPMALTGFLVRYLRGEASRPRQRSRHHRTDLPRNWAIWQAVEGVVEMGYKRTRNAAREGNDSACDIVSGVLVELGISLSADGVNAVWEKQVKMFENLRGELF